MELKKAIINRRSVRKYSNKPVTNEILYKILEVSIHAPTACNMQQYRFIIIESRELKDKIVDYGGATFLKNAPKIILVLYDNRTKNLEYMDHIQSGAAIIQNINLLAHEMGLKTCWVCHLPSQRVMRRLLGIPWNYNVIAAIPVGYEIKPPVSINRKYSINEVVDVDCFSKDFNVPKKRFLIFIMRILLRVYYLIPIKIKRYINQFVDKYFVKKFDN